MCVLFRREIRLDHGAHGRLPDGLRRGQVLGRRVHGVHDLRRGKVLEFVRGELFRLRKRELPAGHGERLLHGVPRGKLLRDHGIYDLWGLCGGEILDGGRELVHGLRARDAPGHGGGEHLRPL